MCNSVTPWTVACQVPLSMDSPGKNTRVGCHFLLQGLFLTWGSNSWLLQFLYWQADSLPLSHVGSPYVAKVKDGISDIRLWKVVTSILMLFHLLLDHPLAGKPVSMLWASSGAAHMVRLLPAKILAFCVHRSQMKNTKTEFRGNRKAVLILSWQRGEDSRLAPQELCPPSPPPLRSLRAYVKHGLAVRSRWWGTKVVGSWFLLALFQRQT